MNHCYHCDSDFYGEDFLTIYCDGCRWDLHYSRQWHHRDTTKEEWINEQRLQRLRKR